MTGFGSLLYTDCRAGQGLRGSPGFQFQAASDGVGRDAMDLVQRCLLYEAPDTWVLARRPVSDYPPSFGHTWNGMLATASGRYLGREANGSREGNHFTHAVLTRDPASYGLVRPAQLYGAPLWKTEPAPATLCSPVDDDWSPGPLDAETVQTTVRDHPHGRDLLATLVAGCAKAGAPDARRIMFVADDAGLVLRWLTAATLLLPQRQALAVGFKVFTTNPAYLPLPVVAVHPGSGAVPATVERDQGYLVIDLTVDRWTRTYVPATATEWAELFCLEDPYDVTDAVELAAASGLDEEPALHMACSAVLGRPLDPNRASDVVRWLAEVPEQLPAGYGDDLLGMLVAERERWPVRVLRDLDRASATGRFGGHAGPVRTALLASELAEAGRATSMYEAPAPAGPTPESAAEAMTEIVMDAIRIARGDAFDATLRVAARFAVPVLLAEETESVDAFIEHWAQHSDRPYDPSLWPDGEELVQRLATMLATQLQADPERAADIGHRWWRVFGDRALLTTDPPETARPEDPMWWLRPPIIAAMMAASPCTERTRIISTMLRRVETPTGLRAAASQLWQEATPDKAELELLAKYTPRDAGIDGAAVDRYVTAKLRERTLIDSDLQICRALVESGALRPGKVLVTFLEDEATIRSACKALPNAPNGSELVDQLSKIAENVLVLHRDELVDAVHRITRPGRVFNVIRSLPQQLTESYPAWLADNIRRNRSAYAVATAFLLSQKQSRVPDAERVILRKGLRRWHQGASDAEQAAVDDVIANLDADWLRVWREWIASKRSSSVLRMWRR